MTANRLSYLIDYIARKNQEASKKIESEAMVAFCQKMTEKGIYYWNSDDYREMYYMIRKEVVAKKVFHETLAQYDFCYPHDIWCAIREFLCAPQDKYIYSECASRSYPGVYNVKKQSELYTFYTKLGKIQVLRASDYFVGTKLEAIFQKKLMCNCFARSYDLAKNHENYKAVLGYLPFAFQCSTWHAYIECEDYILAPSQNCLYLNKEDAKKIYGEKQLRKLSYAEILTTLTEIKKELPDIEMYFNPLAAITAHEAIYKKLSKR